MIYGHLMKLHSLPSHVLHIMTSCESVIRMTVDLILPNTLLIGQWSDSTFSTTLVLQTSLYALEMFPSLRGQRYHKRTQSVLMHQHLFMMKSRWTPILVVFQLHQCDHQLFMLKSVIQHQ